LEILNEGKGRIMEGNISPSFPSFYSPSKLEEKGGRERFLIVLPSLPPIPLTIYLNK